MPNARSENPDAVPIPEGTPPLVAQAIDAIVARLGGDGDMSADVVAIVNPFTGYTAAEATRRIEALRAYLAAWPATGNRPLSVRLIEDELYQLEAEDIASTYPGQRGMVWRQRYDDATRRLYARRSRLAPNSSTCMATTARINTWEAAYRDELIRLNLRNAPLNLGNAPLTSVPTYTSGAGVEVRNCARCGTSYPLQGMQATVRGATICGPCLRRYFARCPDCHGWNRITQPCGNDRCAEVQAAREHEERARAAEVQRREAARFGWISDDADDYDDPITGPEPPMTSSPDSFCDCVGCRRTREGYGRQYDNMLIKDYSYRPHPIFYGGEDGTKLFLGPEIEVEVNRIGTDDAARVAQDGLGALGYLKYDGSLSNGFEIVTHPMSYPWFLENFPFDMFPRIAKKGARASHNCGFHIHASRAGFDSSAHMYRWIKFFYRNKDGVIKIAHRDSQEWAPFRPIDRARAKEAVKPPERRGYSWSSGLSRYSAINVTNKHTFEVRVFASTLEPKRIQSAFGLVSASIEYTRGLDSEKIMKGKAWEWPAFKRYVADSKSIYPALAREIGA